MPYAEIYVYFTGRKSGRKLVVSFVTDGRKSPWLTRLFFQSFHRREHGAIRTILYIVPYMPIAIQYLVCRLIYNPPYIHTTGRALVVNLVVSLAMYFIIRRLLPAPPPYWRRTAPSFPFPCP